MYRDPAHWPRLRVPAEQHPPELETPLADDLAADVERTVDELHACNDRIRAAHLRAMLRELRRESEPPLIIERDE